MTRTRLLSPFLMLAGVLPAAEPPADSPADSHPLVPVLRLAVDAYRRLDRDVADYTCQLTKRERIDGRLGDMETMFIKVRHEQVQDGQIVAPFSVYVRCLAPERVKGREVLYVRGANKGKIIVRNGGGRFAYITTAVPPDSRVAMQESRYPLTEIGMKNLTRRLIENGEAELKYRECAVKTFAGAKINDRPCTLVQVAHANRQSPLAFQYAHIFIDDEWQLPVRYAAYDWPAKEGGAPRLLEEYTYTHLRLNVGLTDEDFDHRNEDYQFLKSFQP